MNKFTKLPTSPPTHNIQTRMLFSGNLTRHPCFAYMKEGKDYRIAGNLINTDKIMRGSFWLGVYPGMTEGMVDFMIQKIQLNRPLRSRREAR